MNRRKNRFFQVCAGLAGRSERLCSIYWTKKGPAFKLAKGGIGQQKPT